MITIASTADSAFAVNIIVILQLLNKPQVTVKCAEAADWARNPVFQVYQTDRIVVAPFPHASLTWTVAGTSTFSNSRGPCSFNMHEWSVPRLGNFMPPGGVSPSKVKLNGEIPHNHHAAGTFLRRVFWAKAVAKELLLANYHAPFRPSDSGLTQWTHLKPA